MSENEKFEIAVQELIETHMKVRAAELCGNQRQAKDLLRGGLFKSCEVLRFMVSDSLLNSLHPSPEAWLFFEELAKNKKLEGFLDVERQILRGFTSLNPDIVEIMVGALRKAIETMIEKHGRLDSTWILHLNQLANAVCERASAPRIEHGWTRFLKRASLGSIGGVFMVVDNLAMSDPHFQMFHLILQKSVDAGSWLISWSATGELDDWAESQTK